jgi:uncharacterized membrane protein
MWAETGLASFFYTQPVWVHWVGIFVLLVLGYQVGVVLQRLLLREPCTDSETALVGSAMALLAFVIGFTFSIALSRYDERRNLVLAEANAIGTTWLRASLVPEPERSELQGIIIRYTDTRLALFDAGEDLDELRRLQRESQRELALLWDATARAVQVVRPPQIAGTLVQTVNETIDLAESRRTTYVVRIPRPVIFAVVGFALITAGLSGFTRGGRRHFILSVFTYAMTASVIALIVDLDRPSAGAIRIQPGPLLETRAGMVAPAAAPSAAPGPDQAPGPP